MFLHMFHRYQTGTTRSPKQMWKNGQRLRNCSLKNSRRVRLRLSVKWISEKCYVVWLMLVLKTNFIIYTTSICRNVRKWYHGEFDSNFVCFAYHGKLTAKHCWEQLYPTKSATNSKNSGFSLKGFTDRSIYYYRTQILNPLQTLLLSPRELSD